MRGIVRSAIACGFRSFAIACRVGKKAFHAEQDRDRRATFAHADRRRFE
jgi:hypothetical protein